MGSILRIILIWEIRVIFIAQLLHFVCIMWCTLSNIEISLKKGVSCQKKDHVHKENEWMPTISMKIVMKIWAFLHFQWNSWRKWSNFHIFDEKHEESSGISTIFNGYSTHKKSIYSSYSIINATFLNTCALQNSSRYMGMKGNVNKHSIKMFSIWIPNRGGNARGAVNVFGSNEHYSRIGVLTCEQNMYKTGVFCSICNILEE